MSNDPAYYRDLLNKILREDEDDDIPTPPSRQEIKLQQFKRYQWPRSPLVKQILLNSMQERDGLHLYLPVGPVEALLIVRSESLHFGGTYYLRLNPNDWTSEVPQTYKPSYDDEDEDEEYDSDELGFQIANGNQEALEAWDRFVTTDLRQQIEAGIERMYNIPDAKLDYMEPDTEDTFFFECKSLDNWLNGNLEPLREILKSISFDELKQHLKRMP